MTNGTCLSYTNNIAILETDWNGLSLNGRWFFVTDTIDALKDSFRDLRLLPGPERMGYIATYSNDKSKSGDRQKIREAHLWQRC